MRKTIVFLILVICAFDGFSQKNISILDRNPQALKHMVYKFANYESHELRIEEKEHLITDSTEHWVLKKCNSNFRVLDSTDFFIGFGDYWLFESRYKAVSIDKFGNILTGRTDFYHTDENMWTNKYRTETTYTNRAEHIRDEFLRQAWDSTGNIWRDETYIKFFGSDGYTEMLSREWDFARNRFVGGNRYVYTINDEDLASSRIAQKWDTVSINWVNDVRNYYTYTVAGKPLEITREIWNNSINSWINYRKDIFEYDLENNNIKQTILYWSGSRGWTNRYLLEKKFNSGNLVVSVLTKQWNLVGTKWEEIQKNEYAYTNDGLLTENLIFRKNPSTDPFKFYQRIGYRYDGKGNQLVYLDQIWDLQSQAWMNTMQTVQEYSPKDEPTLLMKQKWNRTLNGWENEYQENNTYVRNGFHVQYIKQLWAPESELWVNFTRFDNFYSGIKENMGNSGNPVISVPDKKSKNKVYTIYPNPADEKITIHFSKTDDFDIKRLDLIDSYGKLHRSIKINGNADVTIYRNGLKSGKYYLNLIGNERQTETIIFK